MITDQIFRRLSIGGGFSKLLCHPGISWRACHAHMDQLARLQFDDEEGKEWAKKEISDLQEVAGPDLCGVRVQKGRPPLASWLLGTNRPHVLLDRAFAHRDAQFQQFPTNALSSPEPIVPRHLPDQGDGF